MAPQPWAKRRAGSGIPANRSQVRHWGLPLALGVVLGCVLGSVAWLVYEHNQRQQAIANIRDLGGYFSEGAPTFPQWTDQPRVVVGDRFLAPFAKPSQDKRADLWFKPATDADLERVAAMSDLTQLDLSGTKITDRGLASLSGLTKLESLELAYTQVTDAGLVHLKGMTRLHRLRLEQCHITDAGIPHLQAIPSSDLYVHLQETNVTSVKAGELRVGPVGDSGVPRVGQVLLIRGSCVVADANYILDEIDINVLGHEEGSDEASHFGHGTCKPTRRRDTIGGFDFQIQLLAPKRPGDFKVEATTFAKLHSLRAFYTAGVCRIHVQPALAGEKGVSSVIERPDPKD